MSDLVLILCVALPLFGAFLLPIAGRRFPKLRNALALILVISAFVCAILTLVSLCAGNMLELHVALPLGLSFGLKADALAIFMAIASTLVSSIIVLYSYGYMKEYDNQNEYYMMVSFFVGAMMGLVFSTNLIFIYAFWEMSSFCCWRLIGFYRKDLTAMRANKAFIVTVLGALLMLVGFIGIYSQTGTFDLTAMEGVHVPDWCVILILFGILSKSATFPLHNWLPDAGVAPSPVTSLLHAAVLVKIGVYAYARLFYATFAINDVFTAAVPIICAVSALISAGCAMTANDIKRVVAYSTISQLAFILLGISCGNEIGLAGGLLYIMAHSIAKGGLFLCCGIVEHNLHTKDMSKMGGLAKSMPVTAFSFALCAFSVMGIPPFLGFFAKYLVIDGIITAGRPFIGVAFIAGAVMTVMYLMRLFVKVFLGKPAPGCENVKEGSKLMTASVLTLGILSIVLGIAAAIPSGIIELVKGTL